MDEMSVAEDFKATFWPSWKKHGRKHVDEAGNVGIVTVPGPIPEKLLAEYLKGESEVVLSFFVGPTMQDYFGIDVDDHEGGGWVDLNHVDKVPVVPDLRNWVPDSRDDKVIDIPHLWPDGIQADDEHVKNVGRTGGRADVTGGTGIAGELVPTEKLLAKYLEVVKRVGKEPSACFRSTRGVHLYWFFEDLVAGNILKKVIGSKIERHRMAEFLPTRDHALRVPRPCDFLDAELVSRDFPGYAALKWYTNVELFGKELSPDALRERRKQEKAERHEKDGDGGSSGAGWSSERNIERIQQVEAEHGPLRNGGSNDAYKKIVAAHVSGGLTKEQSIARFQSLIDGSPGYTGPLRTELEDRVESSFRGVKVSERKSASKRATELGEHQYVKAFMDWVITEAGLLERPRAVKSMQKFLLDLWVWKLETDRQVQDRALRAERTSVNPGFARMTKAGYYPLPRSLLKGWNDNYKDMLETLKAIGVLVESPFGHSSTLHRCKHYAIQLTECKLGHHHEWQVKPGQSCLYQLLNTDTGMLDAR